MSQLVIEGGRRLEGVIRASGNKNAALKLLPACLLTDEPVILHNIPDIQDVGTTLMILRDLGVGVTDLGGGSWQIEAKEVKKTVLDPAYAGHIRASFVFAGPMLARLGEISLPLPGGDVIGGRPLDTHIQGFLALGVEIDVSERAIFNMKVDKLIGAGYLLLAEASVTATENVIMAAVMAEGETVIDNAASEPHVQDLCHMLVQMGAEIEGIGTNRLRIKGVERLGGTTYRVGADFMEVGSFIGAVAVTGGRIRIQDADPQHLGMIRLVYNQFGIDWEIDGNDIIVDVQKPMVIRQALGGRIPQVKPMPWPGFPPDLMSILLIMATQADGSMLLHDWMYESRFFFVDKLVFMGARIVLCDPHRVIVNGPANLYANPQGVTSPDIRAGMAMVLAALCAQGESVIHNIHQIDRGYEQVERKLAALGAKIKRVE
ncbi:MAG TPA: UDP-N-acetylglucosamine 1-carboxyvinyltransferase [Anaerolineae bacterium]|nr:UDP-N-acetylglucosamine 1-carboxyvinyltransferase [Anaerolineae bacterium]